MIERRNIQTLIFCRRPKLKILILKRIKERGGYWQPVCGGINDNEKPVDAAIRESCEETGINEYEEIYDLNYEFSYEETKNGKLMSMMDTCFAMEVKEVFDVRLSEEHESYIWCTEEEAKQYLQWEHNLIALCRLIDLVRN